MKIKLFGEVKNNKLHLENRDYFDNVIKSFNDKKVTLTIEQYKKTRSDNQNRYYWGVIIELLRNELGYTADEMHDALRLKFLRVRGKVDTIKSTAKLSTVEAEEYYSQIRIWASSELNVQIPEPNEVSYQ